ncbi:MAG: alpha/beta hydrolase, partial [Candidatus Nanopelagicales bacterium]
ISNAIGDNRTPWSAAQDMTAAFTGSRAVQYGGTHHIIYGRVSKCVDRPVTRYLLKLKLPRSTVRCPLEW